MSGIIKVFLLLAALICISKAQVNQSMQSCQCRRVRNAINRNNVKDIQIYPATIFCNKVEIVVTANNGLRYCLNPKMKVVKELLVKIMNKKTTTVSPDSSSTANI